VIKIQSFITFCEYFQFSFGFSFAYTNFWSSSKSI
jgi:hypothetical protein